MNKLSYDLGREQVVPDQLPGDSRVLQEHLSRYLWATKVLSSLKTGDLKKGAILDLPCGSGYGTALIADAFPDHLVHGVDHSAQAVQYARGRYRRFNNAFFVGDWGAKLVRDCHFQSSASRETYDAVVCFEGIEHVGTPYSAFQSLYDRLTYSGLLLLSTPRKGGPGAGSPYHVQEFTLSDLTDLLDYHFSEEDYKIYGQDLEVGDCPAESCRYFVVVAQMRLPMVWKDISELPDVV